jgi:hypothetical protein
MSAVLSAILGLYLGHAQNLDSVSAQLAMQEMQRLLAPARIELAWNTDRDVSQAVIGSFEGSCSLETVPSGLAGEKLSTALADTSVSSNRVLPYFRIDCNRLLRALAPTLRPLSMPLRRAVFGRALGRVMAHEVFHILSQRKDHDERGAAKAAFSLNDLTGREFEFELGTIEAMTPVPLLAKAP